VKTPDDDDPPHGETTSVNDEPVHPPRHACSRVSTARALPASGKAERMEHFLL
jgi:hypothetical protein